MVYVCERLSDFFFWVGGVIFVVKTVLVLWLFDYLVTNMMQMRFMIYFFFCEFFCTIC